MVLFLLWRGEYISDSDKTIAPTPAVPRATDCAERVLLSQDHYVLALAYSRLDAGRPLRAGYQICGHGT